MIKILILDDEASAGNLLKIIIEKHIKADKEILYVDKPSTALELIKDFKPTLLMLDVEMPEMNGFDFLNKTEYREFEVIFTTAYDKYAIKAIRFSALDYLLKPIDIAELQNALNKHILNISTGVSREKDNKLISNLLGNLNQNVVSDFKLALSTSEGLFFFQAANITRLEGDGNYTVFYFTDHKPLMVSKTLKEYEEILSDHNFIRTHKSHLVNKKYVERLDLENILWLIDGSKIIVSRRRRAEVLELLAKQ